MKLRPTPLRLNLDVGLRVDKLESRAATGGGGEPNPDWDPGYFRACFADLTGWDSGCIGTSDWTRASIQRTLYDHERVATFLAGQAAERRTPSRHATCQLLGELGLYGATAPSAVAAFRGISGI
jgi:hypothetical protein